MIADVYGALGALCESVGYRQSADPFSFEYEPRTAGDAFYLAPPGAAADGRLPRRRGARRAHGDDLDLDGSGARCAGGVGAAGGGSRPGCGGRSAMST